MDVCFVFMLLKQGLRSDCAEVIRVLVKGWRTVLRKRAQIVDNFRRNSLACPWEL